MLWDPSVRGEVVSAVAGVVRHTPPWVGRMASTPLTAEVKNALRAEARDIWQNVSGRRAIWDKLEVTTGFRGVGTSLSGQSQPHC